MPIQRSEEELEMRANVRDYWSYYRPHVRWRHRCPPPSIPVRFRAWVLWYGGSSLDLVGLHFERVLTETGSRIVLRAFRMMNITPQEASLEGFPMHLLTFPSVPARFAL